MPNIFDSFMRGQQAGMAHRQFQQQQQDRDSLRQLAPQVIAGDPAAYSQAAAISPEAAGKYADAGDAPYLRLRNAVQLVDRAKSTGNPVALKAALTQISPYIQQLTGKPGPTEWTPDMEPGWEQLKMRIAMADGGKSQLPTGFQEFDMKARAAGLRPGTPEYENAAKVALGVQGRAASGGYGFKEVEGPDGRTRMGRTNPRTGAFEIYDESTGEFVPQGGTAPINGGQGASAGLDAPGYGSAQLNGAPLYAAVGDLVSPLGGRITSTNGGQHNPGSVHQSGGAVDIGMGQETPEQQAKIMAALQGDPRFQVRDERSRPAGQQVWSGPHLHVEPRSSGLGVSRTKEEEARAVEQAKADIQYSNSGRMAEADANSARLKAQAEAQVKAGSDQAALSRSNSTAYNVYEQGMAGLSRGLENANTGPIIGRLPALTADQQAAQGGVAAMAPVLKQMFRAAGEGTFTDKDQALLLDMLPTRADLPEARESKLSNVDNIVRAKLGMPPPKRARNPKTGETLYLRFGQWMKK